MAALKTLQIYGNNGWGGAAELGFELAKRLVAKGWQVDVVTQDPTSVRHFREIPEVRVIDNIRISRGIRPGEYGSALFKLFRLCRAERYDVVHTYNTGASLVGRLAAMLARIPRRLKHHAGWNTGEVRKGLGPVYGAIKRFDIALGTKSLCCSGYIYEEALALPGKLGPKLALVTNGVPVPTLLSADEVARVKRDLFGVESEALVFCSLGRLAPSKDNATLLRAYKLALPKIHCPSVLLVVGEGSDEDDLKALARELELGEQVRFLGYREEVDQILSSIDVYVSASLKEGLSMSLLRAMSYAKAIICTAIPGNMEVVTTGENALVVSCGDIEGIADALVRAGNEDALRKKIGENARSRIQDKYSLERFLDETERFYV